MAAVQTFKTLTDQVLAWLDEANDTSTTRTLVQNALNNANRLRSMQERWHWLRWDTVQTFNTVIGQQTYALHQEFNRPDYFWNRTQLDYVSQYDDATRSVDGLDPNNDTGPALKFQLRGVTEVQNQPASASAIAVSSSDAADNGGTRSVTLKGDTAQGTRSETILCGSTGTVAFTKILKVSKNGTWVGTMTLTAGAVTVLNLFPEESGRSYRQLFLLAKPDAAETIEYSFYRQPTIMVNDGDRPDVPSPFEDLLVYDALLSFSTYNQVDGPYVKIWSDRQQDLMLALQQTEDARALQAKTNYVEYIPR